MKKVNLLSRAEMKKVMGGFAPVELGEDVQQCKKAGDGCKGMGKVGMCVVNEISGTLICEVK